MKAELTEGRLQQPGRRVGAKGDNPEVRRKASPLVLFPVLGPGGAKAHEDHR